MIALDTNLLVYAHRKDADLHQPAASVINDLASGSSPWAIPWPCVAECYSIVTHPRIYAPPSPSASAIDQLDAWLESPTVQLIAEGEGHWGSLRTVLLQARAAGPLVHDARVAALCIAHGVKEQWTADRDFGRFKGLKARNPLVG